MPWIMISKLVLVDIQCIAVRVIYWKYDKKVMIEVAHLFDNDN